MTDLEMTALCAEAVGWADIPSTHNSWDKPYDPLYDDAQAMALVKLFSLTLEKHYARIPVEWYVNGDSCEISDTDLNRAIVECVANMHAREQASA